MTNRPSNLAGSTTDQISLGTLANYEAAFIDLLEEAVSSGRAVRADGLAEIEFTSPVLDDPVGCVPEAVDGGIEVRALVGGEQRARLVARPVADDDNSSTRPLLPAAPSARCSLVATFLRCVTTPNGWLPLALGRPTRRRATRCSPTAAATPSPNS